MYYRTRTYIAGDWDGDKDLIEYIYRCNENDRWSLNFSDAHKLTQSYDTSLPCSIKSSLATRLGASKKFVLIVGNSTNKVTKGGCQFCPSYDSGMYRNSCRRGHNVDLRSFIKYECEKAIRDDMEIVVLYNSTVVSRELCPECIRFKGKHIAAASRRNYFNRLEYDYSIIKDAIMD